MITPKVEITREVHLIIRGESTYRVRPDPDDVGQEGIPNLILEWSDTPDNGPWNGRFFIAADQAEDVARAIFMLATGATEDKT